MTSAGCFVNPKISSKALTPNGRPVTGADAHKSRAYFVKIDQQREYHTLGISRLQAPYMATQNMWQRATRYKRFTSGSDSFGVRIDAGVIGVVSYYSTGSTAGAAAAVYVPQRVGNINRRFEEGVQS